MKSGNGLLEVVSKKGCMVKGKMLCKLIRETCRFYNVDKNAERIALSYSYLFLFIGETNVVRFKLFFINFICVCFNFICF